MTKVTARFIIQIAGKPVENVQTALETIESKIKELSYAKVKDSELIEPALDEESSLFSGMLETHARFDDIEKLMGFIVDFTPNSIEIEDPDTFKLDSAVVAGMVNDLSTHLLRSAAQIRILNANVIHLQKELEKLGVKTKTVKARPKK